MKNAITISTIILLLWIAGSAYWYVCKVRKDCGCDNTNNKALLTNQTNSAAAIKSIVSDAVSTQTDETPPAIPQPGTLTVFFDPGKTKCELTPGNYSHINLFKEYLKENLNKTILVTGHSDNIGSVEINTKISLERAGFMHQKLVEAGIDNKIIEVSYKNDTEPIADNNTAEGRTKNRRTEIQIK